MLVLVSCISRHELVGNCGWYPAPAYVQAHIRFRLTLVPRAIRFLSRGRNDILKRVALGTSMAATLFAEGNPLPERFF